MPEIGLDLGLSLKLRNVVDTAVVYMQAFDIPQNDIEDIKRFQEEIQAFKRVTAYYIDDEGKCIGRARLVFDWYEYYCETDDPDVLIRREDNAHRTPAQILKEAKQIIYEKITQMKKERNFDHLRLVFAYSDGLEDEVINHIRKELGLVPFDKSSINWYDKSRKPITAEDVSEISEYVMTVQITL